MLCHTKSYRFRPGPHPTQFGRLCRAPNGMERIGRDCPTLRLERNGIERNGAAPSFLAFLRLSVATLLLSLPSFVSCRRRMSSDLRLIPWNGVELAPSFPVESFLLALCPLGESRLSDRAHPSRLGLQLQRRQAEPRCALSVGMGVVPHKCTTTTTT